MGSSLAFSLKEDPVRCAKVCDKSWVILIYSMANQSLDRIVNFYDIRNKLKLEINPFGMKKRNLDWNEVWLFNIIGSIWYMISRNLSLIIDWQFCWSQNASETLWSSKDGQFQILKSWVLMQKLFKKKML